MGGVANTTRAVEWNHAPICHSERASESRNLPKWLSLSCGGSFSHVVDSSTPLRDGRNDIVGTFLVFIGNGSVLSGAERHIGRSLRFRW